MCVLTFAIVVLCLPPVNLDEHGESGRLLNALLERGELAVTLGAAHPTRIKCEATIRRLRDMGVKVSREQADHELDRALDRRQELRTQFGLSHPEVVRLHARIAQLAGILSGASEN